MPSYLLLLLLALWFSSTINGESVSGQWKTVHGQSEEWSRNVPKLQSSENDFGDQERILTYRRSATSSEAKYRILHLDFDGFTWIYSPRTASWTRLARIASFAGLKGKSFVGLCTTRAVVFGGAYDVHPDAILLNDAWIFNGVNEKWTLLRTLDPTPPARLGHCAFAFHQRKSSCSCKDSLMVYGGFPGKANRQGTLDDMWELRCVEDRNDLKYRWIRIYNNTMLPSEIEPAHCWIDDVYVFSVNQTHTYWLIKGSAVGELGYRYAAIFNLKTGNWSYELTGNICPESENALPDISTTTYDEERRLLIYKISRGVLGVYNVETRISQCVIHSVDSLVSGLVHINGTLYIQTNDGRTGEMVFWKTKTSSLLEILESNSLGSKLVFEKELITETFPYQLGTHTPYTAIGVGDILCLILLGTVEVIQMWNLHLDSLMWTLYDPDQTPGADFAFGVAFYRFRGAFSATVNSERIAYFGSYFFQNSDRLWIYTVDLRQWSKVENDGVAPKALSSGSYATMNSMENGSLLIFGEIDEKEGSIWMATVNYESMTATWRRLCCKNGWEKPLKRLEMWSSGFWNNTFYVYFATDPVVHRYDSGVIYHIKLFKDDLKWLITDGIWPFQYREWNSLHSTQNGRFVFASTRAEQYVIIADLSEDKMHTTKLPGRYAFTESVPIISENVLFLMLFNTNATDLMPRGLYRFDFTKCHPTTYSSDYSLYPCLPCPKGQYNNRYGATNCTRCPPGLVTSSIGSESIRNCTCAKSSCSHGNCIIQADYTTACLCDSGFTGETCEIPTMYLIGIGIVVGLLLSLALYCCIKRVKKHRKEARYARVELEMAERTVAELSNIWSVDNEEIQFRRMIGEGSFGDVWIAKYRDEIVAVKVLKIKAEDCTHGQLQDFKDESDLLRSIFHANIVRLIGTGKTAENKPFIVLEYMEKGSVRNELDNEYADHPMDVALQAKYALDAAKGMRHLHGINRMHRDLKCDNLLINEKRIVKVADFGCTKIAPTIDDVDDGANGTAVRGSRAVGTALFRAPEIVRGEAYNGAVDVYSYGIALWEIMTAKRPYFEKFDEGMTVWDVLDHVVQRDVRPTFPARCHDELKKIAESCWNRNAFKRPTFEEIVEALEGVGGSLIRNDVI